MEGWSKPSELGQNGVHEGYRSLSLVGGGKRSPQAELFGFVLDEFEPVHTAWLSWIDPGGYIKPHTDAGPWRERWQIPIHAAGWFDQNGERFQAVDGKPFQVCHWEPHSLGNDTNHPRIHLVLDRDILIDRPSTPFTLM